MRLAQSGVRRRQDNRHDGPAAARDRSCRSARVGDVAAIKRRLAAYRATTRSPASTSSKPSAPAGGPRLAHQNPHARRGIPSVMRPCHRWTQLDLIPPPRSGETSVTCGNAGRRNRLHGSRPGLATPGTGSARAADLPGSGPPLAHTSRERSAGPPPGTPQARPPGTPAPGLTWGFVWQVLGSNQRRLSRRFYRQPSMRTLCVC